MESDKFERVQNGSKNQMNDEFKNEQVPEKDVEDMVEELGYSKKTVAFVFRAVFLMNMGVNADHGAIPACLREMQNDLGLLKVQVGNFGSLVFFGLGIGSLLVSMVIGRISYKMLIALSCIGNSFGLFMFAYCNDYQYLCFSRFFCGINQIAITIYHPLFVDCFGTQETKPIWMSTMILAPSLGVVSGYGLTFYCIMVYDSWRLSFAIQGVIFIVFAIIVICLPNDYINIDVVHKLREVESIKRSSGVFSKKDKDISGVVINIDPTQFSSQSDAETPMKSVSQINPHAQPLTDSLFQDTGNHNSDDYFSSKGSCQNSQVSHQKTISKCQEFKLLMCNVPFVGLTLGLTALFSIMSGVQYWSSDYYQESLGLSKTITCSVFVIMSTTAPISGALLSAKIGISIGGWQSKRAMFILVMANVLLISVSLPITFFNNSIIVSILFWMVVLIGGFIVTGSFQQILSFVEVQHRPFANSIANFSFQMVGYLPAPLLYGIVQSFFGDERSRWGMFALMIVPVFSALFYMISYLNIQDKQEQPKYVLITEMTAATVQDFEVRDLNSM